jgi:YHS domain-containing protein
LDHDGDKRLPRPPFAKALITRRREAFHRRGMVYALLGVRKEQAMAQLNTLGDQIRKEFAAHKKVVQRAREQRVAEHVAREARAQNLEQLFDQLRDVWRPRLESLAREFGELVQASPTIKPGRRTATFDVKSPLASIQMTIAASANSDVKELVLIYDLQILPILMDFERHAELSFPLDQVDTSKVGAWLDERILGFVKTYLEMQSNEYYLKDQMVEDPVAHVRFPKLAAEATREKSGKTYYFISDETAAAFGQQASCK